MLLPPSHSHSPSHGAMAVSGQSTVLTGPVTISVTSPRCALDSPRASSARSPVRCASSAPARIPAHCAPSAAARAEPASRRSRQNHSRECGVCVADWTPVWLDCARDVHPLGQRAGRIENRRIPPLSLYSVHVNSRHNVISLTLA